MKPLVCPSCGGTQVYFEQFVRVGRLVLGQEPGQVIVDPEADFDWNDNKGRRLYCMLCRRAWHTGKKPIIWKKDQA